MGNVYYVGLSLEHYEVQEEISVIICKFNIVIKKANQTLKSSREIGRTPQYFLLCVVF